MKRNSDLDNPHVYSQETEDILIVWRALQEVRDLLNFYVEGTDREKAKENYEIIERYVNS